MGTTDSTDTAEAATTATISTTGAITLKGSHREPPPDLELDRVPGAALDGLLARYVLGWSHLVWEGKGWGREYMEAPRDWALEGEAVARRTYRGWFGIPPQAIIKGDYDALKVPMPFHMGTEINTVLAKLIPAMHAADFDFHLLMPSDDGSGGASVHVSFTRISGGPGHPAVAHSLTRPVPLARTICIAALRAFDAPELEALGLAGDEAV